jgi:hypothetical protein
MVSPGILAAYGESAAVLLTDWAGGRELAAVREALAGPLRTPTMLLRGDDLRRRGILVDLASGAVTIGNKEIQPAVVWTRHCTAGVLQAQAQPAGSVSPMDAASWAGVMKYLADTAAAALPGSAPTTLGQLLDADRLGVRTPRTVVTTDVPLGVHSMMTRRVLVKTPDFRLYQTDRRTWQPYFPVIVDASAGAPDFPCDGPPSVIQEYVEHDRELRVYWLNGGICAFDVSKPGPASSWQDPRSVAVRKVGCPGPAAHVVRVLSAAWNLRYAAFDLLVSSTGEVVFLEANSDGDWLWYERKAGWYGVSFMAAVMVRELFIRVTDGQ